MTPAFAKISKVLATSLGITVDELIKSFGRAEKADFPAVCELMHLGFGDAGNLAPEVIAWRYFDFSNHCSDVFILRYQSQIIGAVGAEPIRVKLEHAEVEGIRAGDIVVHPDHMRQGIGAWMNLCLQENFPVVMAMGSNENSTTMVRRIFKPMNCRHHLKILFSTRRYLEFRGWSPLLTKAITLLAVLPLALVRFVFFKMLPRGYRIEVVDNTDNFPDFFNSSDYRHPQANIVMRSAQYCRWRYDLNPKSSFKIFELYKKNLLSGYAIVKKNGREANDDWQLMDWDLLPSLRNQKHLRLLFSGVVKWVAHQHAESLSVMASDSLSLESLVHSGFSHRAVEDGFYLWTQPDISATALDEKRWFLTFCDTDEAL